MSATARNSESILRIERALKAQLHLTEAAEKGRGLTAPEELTTFLLEEAVLTALSGGLAREDVLECFRKAWDMAEDGLLPRSGLGLGANHPLMVRPRR